jgi:hypothetical protein
MNLKAAVELLGDGGRYFSAVYEEFKYKDEDLLKDYVDFIYNEPVEWIKGFPLKLRNRQSFARPKATLIRLLKLTPVKELLGAEYCSKAHDLVWDTFKKHADTILNGRVKKGLTDPKDGLVRKETQEPTQEPAEENTLQLEEISDVEAEVAPVLNAVVESVVAKNTAPSLWERKFHVVSAGFRALVQDSASQAGLVNATLLLLDTLEKEWV